MILDNPRKVLLCQPKTILVSAGFNAGQSASGIVSLQTRIDNIIAYRLKYFNLTLNPADWDPNVFGTIFTLRSSALASNRNTNHFVTALSPPLLGIQSGIDTSNIIGYNSVPQVATSLGSQIHQQQVNHLQSLSRPLCIEKFDWSIDLLSQPITALAHQYRAEFAIEFYCECQCQTRVVDVYGS